MAGCVSQLSSNKIMFLSGKGGRYHKKCPRRVVEEDRSSGQKHGGSHELAQLEYFQSAN